jgi:hypothetical protein
MGINLISDLRDRIELSQCDNLENHREFCNFFIIEDCFGMEVSLRYFSLQIAPNH